MNWKEIDYVEADLNRYMKELHERDLWAEKVMEDLKYWFPKIVEDYGITDLEDAELAFDFYENEATEEEMEYVLDEWEDFIRILKENEIIPHYA